MLIFGRMRVGLDLQHFTRYPCRREKARVVCVEHVHLLQAVGGDRVAAILKARDRIQNEQTKRSSKFVEIRI